MGSFAFEATSNWPSSFTCQIALGGGQQGSGVVFIPTGLVASAVT